MKCPKCGSNDISNCITVYLEPYQQCNICKTKFKPIKEEGK